MAKKIDVGGELNSTALDKKLVDAAQVKDGSRGDKTLVKTNEEIEYLLAQEGERQKQFEANETARQAEADKTEQDRADEAARTEAVRQATFEANEAERQVLYEKVETNKEGIELLNANTGISEYPTFEEAKAYAVGDVVIFEDLMYRFTSAHEAGAWDSSQVEAWSERKEVDGKIGELKNSTSTRVVSDNPVVNSLFSEVYFVGFSLAEIESIKTISFFSTDTHRGVSLRTKDSSLIYQLISPIEDKLELLKAEGRTNFIGMYVSSHSQYWPNSVEDVKFNISAVTNLAYSPSIAMKLIGLFTNSSVGKYPDVTIANSRIDSGGNAVVANENWYVSIVDVHQGDIIQFVSDGNVNVAPISKLTNGVYTPVVAYNTDLLYNYLSDFDGQLAFSVFKGALTYINKIESPLVQQIISSILSNVDYSPVFRIDNGNLQVSYDNGNSWDTLGNVVGATETIDYNDIVAVAKQNNKESIVYLPSEEKRWELADADGVLSDNLFYVYDDVYKKEIKAIKYISNNNGRIILPIGQSVDMTSNVLRGSICIEKSYDTANLSHLIVEVYSNETIDSAHRALMYIQQASLNSEYNVQYVRAGWFHFIFCPDVNIPVSDRGSAFDITNITHIGIHPHHNTSIPLTIYVGDFSITTPLEKPGVVTIIDNFDASVPLMADYAYSKGVRLNLSIIPNWIGTDASATLGEIERIKNQGHLIINHTWNHIIDTSNLSKLEIVNEIIKGSEWMLKNGYARGSRIVSNPSAMFPTNKYMAYMESPADVIYHHWTTMRDGGTAGTTLHYPFSPMERLLNISTLDKCNEAVAAASLAKQKGAIAVNGYHGRYWAEDGGVNWKSYIDQISNLDIHHYTIDELLEGDFV